MKLTNFNFYIFSTYMRGDIATARKEVRNHEDKYQ